jgi:hypothetical protein
MVDCPAQPVGWTALEADISFKEQITMFREPKEIVKGLQTKFEELWRYL